MNEDSLEEAEPGGGDQKRRGAQLSWKDAGVIVTLSTTLSVGVLLCTVGRDGIQEKLEKHDIWELLGTLVFFIGLFTLIAFVLVKMAAHYLVYLAMRTLFAIVFPVSPHRQRRAIQKLYNSSEKSE